MLDQVCPCSSLEFIQSRFQKRPQLWRGVNRHGDEGRCLVVNNRWREGGRNSAVIAQIHEALGEVGVCAMTGLGSSHETCYQIGMIDAQAYEVMSTHRTAEKMKQ